MIAFSSVLPLHIPRLPTIRRRQDDGEVGLSTGRPSPFAYVAGIVRGRPSLVLELRLRGRRGGGFQSGEVGLSLLDYAPTAKGRETGWGRTDGIIGGCAMRFAVI